MNIPEGFVLVPASMHLDRETIGAINFHCGDGADGQFGEYSHGLLWVGAVTDDEGKEVHGLHLATAEYLEEGSTTLVEFPAVIAQPAAHLTIPGALEWDGDNGTHSADGESRVHGEPEQAEKPAAFEISSYGGRVERFVVREDVATEIYDKRVADGAEDVRVRALFARSNATEVAQLRAQLASTEQSRRSFFDLSQDLEKRLAERDALLRESSDWIKANSFGGCDAVDLWERIDAIASAKCESCGGWGHIETEDSAHDCPECGPIVIERAVEAGVMNAPSKQKICIECDQPYCRGVCVERGDQDYDRDQAAKGGDQ